MGRRFLVLSLLILSFSAPPKALAIDDIKAGVVKVSAHVEGKSKIGTGFIVNLEPAVAYIVTASHVVEGADVCVAFFAQPHDLLTAKTIGLEGGDPKGLAALKVVGFIPSNDRALNFDRSVTVRGGGVVKTVGFPRMGAIPWAVASGTILGRKGRHIAFTGAVDEGNSGGPLVSNALVIGAITEIIGEYNYAQPADTVESFLTGLRVKFSDDTDKRLVQDALSRFHREQGVLVELTERQNSALQSLLKHHGEYWGQVWLGLSAGGVALIPKDSEASRKRVQSVLDAAAQVWAGRNLADSMRNLKPLDALKKLANVIDREAAGAPLDDNSVWRIRQKALKDKGIFIRDEFQRGGPDLRELK